MDLSNPVVNGVSAPTTDTNANANPSEEEDIDPVWLSSRTARQIYSLCQVEKVSAKHNATLHLFHTHYNIKIQNTPFTVD